MNDLATKKNRGYFDYPLLFMILCLVAFGLIMVYSAGAYGSYGKGNSIGQLFMKQGIFAAAGLTIMYIISRFDYHLLKKKWIAEGSVIVSLAVLILVFLIGKSSNGSTRWIEVGPIQIQPSEFVKVFVIFFLAYYLAENSHNMGRIKELVIACAPPVVLSIVVAIENLSTALIILTITGILVFVVSPRTKELIIFAVFAIIAIAIMVLLMGGYRVGRIQTWLHPEEHIDDAYQTLQGLYAIGSGGLFGKGLGNSIQKLGSLPEAHNDMIFAIICEELGLFGGLCVILAFVVLIWRILVIAMNAKDIYGSLLASGVAVHIFIQVLINLGVATNTIPSTGIPLPFISYGGSSLLVLFAEIGMVFSVGRGIKA